MAVFLLLLAIVGGVVVADLVRENPTAADVTVFNQPVSGHSQGRLLAMAAALGALVVVLLMASMAATRARRARRRQLRAFRAALRRQRGEPDPGDRGLLDELLGREATVDGPGGPDQPTDRREQR
jgi:hypothetical protein